MILLLLLTFIYECLSTFKILEPITSNFKNNSVQYGVANFGDIPYGTTLTGFLSRYTPLDLCKRNSMLNSNLTII